MLRHWRKATAINLSYHEAYAFMESKKGFFFATRPEWQGFHYIGEDGRYRVFFSDGHYEIIDPKEAWGRDKEDWMIVTIKPETHRLLQSTPNGGIPCQSRKS